MIFSKSSFNFPGKNLSTFSNSFSKSYSILGPHSLAKFSHGGSTIADPKYSADTTEKLAAVSMYTSPLSVSSLIPISSPPSNTSPGVGYDAWLCSDENVGEIHANAADFVQRRLLRRGGDDVADGIVAVGRYRHPDIGSAVLFNPGPPSWAAQIFVKFETSATINPPRSISPAPKPFPGGHFGNAEGNWKTVSTAIADTPEKFPAKDETFKQFTFPANVDNKTIQPRITACIKLSKDKTEKRAKNAMIADEN
nr:hypothetical protein Iba_chr12bCG6370 [Ipomoea batatas]